MLGPMNDIVVGQVVRAVRRRLGLSQRQVAERAGVSQQTVSVIERGRLEEVDLATLRRVGAVLGIDMPFAPRWRGPELDRLLDAGHAAIVETVVSELREQRWTVLVEWSFNRYGERGSVDVLAWHPDRSALVVVEVKTRIVDLQDLLGTLDRKVRIAAELLPNERGWRPSSVGRIVVLPDTSTSRDAVDRHRATFGAALPGRTIAVRRWLRAPVIELRAVWFLRSTSRAGEPGRRVDSRGGDGRAASAGARRILRDTSPAGGNPA
jgi:transcriptional regulator with XRE-family HTH domain